MNDHRAFVLAVLFACFSFSSSLAQHAKAAPPSLSPQLTAELRQLQEAALHSDYAYEQVAYLADNIGPRLSGSPQAEAAVQYVAQQLRQLGLEVQLEKVMVPHWVRGEETAELTKYSGQAPKTTQRIVVTALGGSVATPAEGITADVVVVKDFDELNALGRAAVKGKIVLFNEVFDRRLAETGFGGAAYSLAVKYRSGGVRAAADLGAVASLIRSVGGAEYRLPHTGAMMYGEETNPGIPAGAVTAEDADLVAHLAKQGPVRMRLTLTPQQLSDAVSYNVIGDWKGSEHPEEIVIVSGHLDSWDLGTGAIDDAAGVAMAMETAHLICQLGLRPKRTIRVIAWMNEENGLRGGTTYAADHKADAGRHFAAIESDLGAGHPVGILAKAGPAAIARLKPVAEALEPSGVGMLVTAEDTGSDLGPLGQLGVPTFSPMQDSRTYFDYHHTPADTLDKVNLQELRENSAVVAVLAYAVASMPDSLR